MNSEDNIVFVLLVLFVIYLFTPSSPKEFEERDVYFAYCSDFKHNTFSCPNNEYLMVSKTRFKIFLKEQMVVSDSFDKMTDCTVFDVDNWECRSRDYSKVMRNGDYWNLSEGSLDKNGKYSGLSMYQQIPSVVYYVRSVVNFVRSL